MLFDATSWIMWRSCRGRRIWCWRGGGSPRSGGGGVRGDVGGVGAAAAGRFLQAATITSRVGLVRRLAAFSNQYPWQWQLAEYEAFIDGLRSGDRGVRFSTARGYECDLRLFLEYVTDVRYGWPAAGRLGPNATTSATSSSGQRATDSATASASPSPPGRRSIRCWTRRYAGSASNGA